MTEPEVYTPPTATVSSLNSDHSTEQLISPTPNKRTDHSVTSKSVEPGSEHVTGRKRVVVLLGLAQLVAGVALVSAGAAAVVKGAALARVGAGLWAGCVAVVTGVIGLLAGINDCYGLYGVGSGSPLLTAFLALSLLCLACGNSAAVLAATGLQRDALRPDPAAHTSFQDEMQAWSPVLANIAVLIVASVHCLISVVSIYCLSRRVCPCFRSKQPFDHNQFDPTFKAVQPIVVHAEEGKAHSADRNKNHQLCKDLEVKLQGDTTVKKKKEDGTLEMVPSKEHLVTRWLGRHQPAGRRRPPAPAAPTGVRKQRHHATPVMLLPAHPASTLGRMGPCVMVPPAGPRYATLPLPPPAPLYHYPIHDNRVMRRRSPRSRRSGGGERRRARAGRERDSQLARSLERIHRKRRPRTQHDTDADLKRTYTGLDRTYAEQFIQVIDESRQAAERHDSLPSNTDTTPSNNN